MSFEGDSKIKARFCCRLRRALCAVICLVLLLSAVGCANNEQDEKQDTGKQDEEALVTMTSVWPENEYTKGVPKPENGTVESVMEMKGSPVIYSISITGITRQQAMQYIEALQDMGFEKVASENEKSSGGTLMEKEDKALSIAYSGENMIIGIIPFLTASALDFNILICAKCYTCVIPV